MRNFWRAGLTALALATGGLVPAVLAETPATIIVMDGSGSMWGQIGGRPKLEIARETVAGVLEQIPAAQRLGLLAYGHRERGNCGDIELMVPPAPGTAGQIREAVNAMRFLGKTPLSDAVRQAATALRYGEEAATVVLVTDGLETCAADPCAMATELEASGLNFTAHVIGFGLTSEEGAQVACLAENTGGRYFAAGDAEALADALKAAVAAEEPPVEAPEPTPAPKSQPLPRATIDAPAAVPIGQPAAIGWTGPGAALDTIEIGLPGDGKRAGWVYVADGNPVSLLMPGTPGLYELRYKLRDQTVIATRPIEVTEAPATLSAPAQVLAGSSFQVGWTGPDAPQDNIQISEAGSDSYLTYDYVNSGNPLTLTAPQEPGRYELRYKFADTEVIASRPIEVLPADAVLPAEGPAPLPVEIAAEGAGDGLAVVWSAVPVAGQDLPPEAWAMPEAISGPVTAEFLPGVYDVTGEAEGQRFAGRIEVVAVGENRFVIPLAPAPEEQGAAQPVPLKIRGVYDGAFASWQAWPLSGQEAAELSSGAPRPGVWEAALLPGRWLIRGRHEGARGATYLAMLGVAAGMAPEVTIARPRFAATEGAGDPFAWMCDGALPCFLYDGETRLQLGLPLGWGMSAPGVMETAAGEGGELFAVFQPLRADREAAMVALNPRQWDATLGPCEDIAIGRLCRDAGLAGEDLQAYRMIRATLEYRAPEETEAQPVTGDLADRIGGTRLEVPEGLDLLEILAPHLAPKE
ncbi:hypothetical protein MASR2M74_03860 [Paracoccaceae bacterium]